MQFVKVFALLLTAATAVGSARAGLADDLFDYGAYLASECTSCHQVDGSYDGIPSIVGWPESLFVEVMQGYSNGTRRHLIMENVAKSLGEDEFAALARYFHAVRTGE